MLLSNFEQPQRRAIRLPLPLLPRADRIRTHVESRSEDRLRELHVVTNFTNPTRSVLGRRLDLRLSHGIARDAGGLDLAALDSGSLPS
jgi:hypothetical protein